ncbi:MAG: class II fructose-bisphosphate aldolase, partial [Sulfurovaceae bacterium]|nr:class II fructose-bisphosphate aldolase [Sulfurovaceae bacterium]
MSQKVLDNLPSGILSGDEVQQLFDIAKHNEFAIPAVNVVSSSSINAVLESASKVNSPIIIQFSNGGGDFYAGKGLSSKDRAVLGTISGAKHIHTVAKAYGIPIVLHTDHANRKLLPWIDTLLDESEKLFAQTSKPLFSSHMIDLSEEPIEENIATCKEYLARMS